MSVNPVVRRCSTLRVLRTPLRPYTSSTLSSHPASLISSTRFPSVIQTAAMSTQSLSSTIQELQKYSACDIADALLKLEPKSPTPRAGFLADISTQVPSARSQKIIAPAFTVLFHSKSDTSLNADHPANIPAGSQWSDLTEPDSIVLIHQPEGQYCAAVGGHHASRIAKLGAKGLVVSGRIRDLADMAELGMPIWARGTSVVGAGAESKPRAVQVPVEIDGVTVSPGDLIFLDPAEGAVRIPRGLVEGVLAFLPKHAGQEEGVKKMIAEGSTVQQAFDKCRI